MSVKNKGLVLAAAAAAILASGVVSPAFAGDHGTAGSVKSDSANACNNKSKCGNEKQDNKGKHDKADDKAKARS